MPYKKLRNGNIHTKTHSLTHPHKYLYMTYVSYCYHSCYSVWQQLFETRECLSFIGPKPNSAALFGPLDTLYTCYCFSPSRGGGHPSLPSSFPVSFSPHSCHLNILALNEEVHREEQKEKCNTCYKWDPLFCIPIAHFTCSVSCLFCHSHPSQCSRHTLPHHPSRCKTRPYHDEWWVQMGVFQLWRVLGQVL